MTSVVGIVQNLRRRNGSPGAPALRAGQLFHNESENGGTIYAGFGDDRQRNATSVVAVGGPGLLSSAVLGTLLATLPTSPPSTTGLAWLDNGAIRVS